MKSLTRYFELQSEGTARWLPMEGYRGLAVLLVFFVHYSTSIGPFFALPVQAMPWLIGLHESGKAGVDIFFVLSGFLIYRGLMRKPLNVRAYARRRFVRIYPTFALIMLVYIALSLVVPSISQLPGSPARAAFSVGTSALLLPGILPIPPLIEVAWSLSYEAFFYIAAPLGIALLRLPTWSSRGRLLFFLAAFMAATALEAAGFFVHYRLTLFLGGMALYEIAPKEDLPLRQGHWGIDALAFIGLIMSLVVYTLLGDNAYLLRGTALYRLPEVSKFLLLTPCIVFALYRSLFYAGPLARIFCVTPLRWLGNMSYSFYLAHALGIHAFFKAVPYLWPRFEATAVSYAMLAPVVFTLSLAVSVPVYLLCERPFSLTKTP